jgi:hypothetical protein
MTENALNPQPVAGDPENDSTPQHWKDIFFAGLDKKSLGELLVHFNYEFPDMALISWDKLGEMKLERLRAYADKLLEFSTKAKEHELSPSPCPGCATCQRIAKKKRKGKIEGIVTPEKAP